MFSTLVLCSIIALAFCCISLLYFYYCKLKHIAYLESQLISLKMMFANYQNSVEYKLSSMLATSQQQDGKKIHPNVMTVLDNDNANDNEKINFEQTNNKSIHSKTESPITKSVEQAAIITNLNPILTQLLPDDELMQNGPIPFFQIVSMTSNPRFTNPKTTQNITEITDDGDCNTDEIQEQKIDIDIDIARDIDIEELEYKPSTAIQSDRMIVGHINDFADEIDNEPEKQPQNLNLELKDLEFENFEPNTTSSLEDDIKKISLEQKPISPFQPSSANGEDVKTVNLVSNAEFKLNGSSMEQSLETSLDGIMDELEELSDIASVCDDTRTININTMTPADLSNLSVKELKDLCSKYKIKNKKGNKTELIERLNSVISNKT